MASVDVFFQDLATCGAMPLIKGSVSHSAMQCQTFSQVQYRLCIRDFATLFVVPFPGVAKCGWLQPPAGDWDELFTKSLCLPFHVSCIQGSFVFKTDCEIDEAGATCF